MKIIYFVHQFFPEFKTGTENFILNTALMAQKFGNDVKVITYSFYGNDFYEHERFGVLFKEFYYDGVQILAFKFSGKPIDINIVETNSSLYNFAQAVIAKEVPDLIHIGHPMRLHEFILASQDLQVPYIITLTDFFLICPKIILQPGPTKLCSGPQNGNACSSLCPEFNPAFIKARLLESEEILKGAKCIVGPSNFVMSIFNNEYPDLSYQVVPHGIRYSRIKKNCKTYKKGQKLIFGFLGNIIYHKGVHILIQAFKNIENEDTSLKIYGFGLEGFMNKLKSLASTDQRISFEGEYKSENLSGILNEIDMLVIPNIWYETYSFVLHEAFASNVPVIAADLGVMHEKIAEGDYGLLFKPGDSNDLKIKMEQIINNPEILNKMKRNLSCNLIVPTIEQEAYSYREIYRNNINLQN